MKITLDFTMETLKATRAWTDVLLHPKRQTVANIDCLVQ